MRAISEQDIHYWADLLKDHCFSSERELRKTVFKICEQRCRQSWSTPEGKVTIHANLKFARSLPVEEKDGEWKVAVNEYLSNMTSDFSDGTNGEPTGYPPSGGDMGSSAGLPDYKYNERLRKRREKLKALIQRRDPDGIEKRIGEAEDDDFDDVHDVEPEPSPTYDKFPEQSFGWALNLGSEQEIQKRAHRYTVLRLGPKTWEKINDAYMRIERNIVAILGNYDGASFTDQGHSDDFLVGAGWVTPSKAPDLWRVLTHVPERTPIDLLSVGHVFGLDTAKVYAGTPPIMQKLLVPVLEIFDTKPGPCPECQSFNVIEVPMPWQEKQRGKDASFQCENCGHILTP